MESNEALRSRARYKPILLWSTLSAALAVLVIGLIGAGATGFWRDEATSIGISRRSLDGVLRVIENREANMALYYIVLHFWIDVGGEGVVWVRSLSVIFAVLTVPVLVWIGCELFDHRVGVLTALLLPGSAVVLRSAAEARAYSMAIFWGVCTVGLLLYAINRASRIALLLTIVTASAMVYSQVLSLLLLLGIVLPQALSARRALGLRTPLLSSLFFLLVVSPLLWFSVARDRGQTSWIRPTSLASFRAFAVAFGGSVAATIAILLVVITAIVLAVRAGDRHSPIVFTLSWLVVPVLALLLVSFIKPLFIPRYVAVTSPALVLLTALVIASLELNRRRIVAVILLIATLTGSISAAVSVRADDSTAAAAYVSAYVESGDAVVYDPAISRGSVGVLMPQTLRDIAVTNNGSPEAQGDIWAVERSAPEVAALLLQQKRVWVVSFPGADWIQTPEPFREVRAFALPQQPVQNASFGELVVQLYQR